MRDETFKAVLDQNLFCHFPGMEAVKLLCILSGLMNPESQLLLKDDWRLTLVDPTVDGSGGRQEMTLHRLNPRGEILHLGPGTLTTVEKQRRIISLTLHCIGIWPPPCRAAEHQPCRKVVFGTEGSKPSEQQGLLSSFENVSVKHKNSETVKYAIGLELTSSTGDT